MGSFRQDLRYAFRTLIRQPGFTAIAVLTIALGIGASTSIFSIVNAVLLEPLSLHEPERLVLPQAVSHQGYDISLSIPNFRDWRDRSRSFESFGANMSANLTLTGVDRPQMIRARWVLGDYFETLGVAPRRGRTITSDETWAGAPPIAVATHAFWENRLGGDPDVLGRSITLNGVAFEIVGVMPAGFAFPSADSELYLPMGYIADRLCWDQRDCAQGSFAFARLRDGVTREAAQRDLDRITREIAEEEGQPVATARLEWVSDVFVGDVRAPILLLMGAVAFVLLIACANVANLLLVRGEGRSREIAIRTALGAGRGRVLRLFLTESLALGLTGGVLGVGIAAASIPVLVGTVADEIPSILLGRIGLDLRVLAFTCVLSLGAGLLFGIAPALRASGRELSSDLKEGDRGGTTGRARQRLRSGLAAGQVALSLMLLIGAGLMIESIRNLRNVDKGFTAENVFTARVSLPSARYGSRDQVMGFFDRLLEDVKGIPGVAAASLTQIVPLQGNSWEQGIVPEGVPPGPETSQSVLHYIVTPGYFGTLGIPMLRGRGFGEADRSDAPAVCVIDETLAERFWPGEDPIGKRVSFEFADGSTDEDPVPLYRTVVGVVKNVRHYELESRARITVYVPLAQSEQSWSRSMYVVAATPDDPLALTDRVRGALNALDPELPLYQVQTMEGYVTGALSGTRLVGGLLGAFSALALVLSAVGLFGVVSFTVVRRLREIGIRLALGAEAADVLGMVARQGLAVALLGVGLGLAGALAVTRLLTGLLYEVNPVEPMTYGALAAFLVAVSLLASYLPARRATRIDPLVVLRDE